MDKFEILIKLLTGKEFNLTVYAMDTVDSVKKQVATHEGIPIDQQRLIAFGKQLEDGRSMSDYRIQPGTEIHCILRLRGGMPRPESMAVYTNKAGEESKLGEAKQAAVKCPGCKNSVANGGGSNQSQCAACGHRFCHLCGKEWTLASNMTCRLN